MSFSPEVISSTISTLGAFVLVYLSVVKDNHVSKTKIRREQLEKFYVPFYKIYCRGFLSELALSELSIETWECIFNLMTDNLHLMEPASQAMYSKYYAAYLDAVKNRGANSNFAFADSSEKFDEVFDALCILVFTEYAMLLNKSKLPVPILPTPKRNGV